MNLQRRCKERNIKLNEEKAAIKQTEIPFIGHLITKDGVLPNNDRISAILNMPDPKDIHDVKHLCGMIQYMAKFLPNLAEDLEPIRKLTRKEVVWEWSKECKEAFQVVKKKLTSAPILSYYDPDKELTIQVDSSKDGIGAALIQEGRPIEYASRALTQTERKWAQIEKETLAVVYGLERFDQYTYGRNVKVQNDHKPLERILKKPLNQAPRRIQALLMRLYRYDVTFEYVPGNKLIIADTLSRAFVETDELDQFSNQRIMTVYDMLEDLPDARCEEIRQATVNDPLLQRLINIIKDGWPDNKYDLPEEIRPYFAIRDTLSYNDNLVVNGERIVVPKSLQNDMKKRLHTAHLGYDSMIRRARKCIYWCGMAKDIKQVADNCDICFEHKPRNQKESLKQHAEGKSPFEKVGVDLCEYHGLNYLITVDYFTNFIEVDYLSTISSKNVITCLSRHFARYGIPKCLISDCGSQFTSQEFKQFMTKWGIVHFKSSPGHHQANGKAEAGVKIVKNLLKKSSGDPYLALLELRNTPRQDGNQSPAELMFGRSTRSTVPSLRKQSTDSDKQQQQYLCMRERRRQSIRNSYNRKSKDLKPLGKDQPIYYQNPEKSKWNRGKIQAKLGERTYVIEGENNTLYNRNRVHLKERHTKEMPEPSIEEPVILPETVNDHKDTICENGDHNGVNSDDIEENVCEDSNRQTPEPRPMRIRRKPNWLKDYVCTLINSG